MRHKKRFLALGVIVIACLLFYFLSKASADIGANVINTSYTNASGPESKRSLFYDSVNNLYWVFYGTIDYSYSSNGSSWSSGGSLGTGPDWSVWYVPGTTTVYVAWDDTSNGVYVNKGTLGASSISWGTAKLTTLTTYVTYPSISRSSNGTLWVEYKSRVGSLTIMNAGRSTNPDDQSSWVGPTTLVPGLLSASAYSATNVVPLTTAGDMYFTYFASTTSASIAGNRWTNGSSQMSASQSAAILPNASGAYPILSSVSMATDLVHSLYQDCSASGGCANGGTLKYVEYSSGAWGTPVTVDSNTSNLFPCLTKNGTDLYAFYIRSNTIYYRKGVSPYGAGNWGAETTLVSSGTNTALSCSYDNSNGYALVTWISGTSNPYNINFYGLSLGSSGPTQIVFSNAARTLTAGACNGAASVFTMQLQDGGGTPQNPTQTTVVQVTSNSSSYTIYSDSTCTTPVSGGNFTYTTSDNTKSVYIIDNKKSISTRTLTGTRTSGDTLTTGTQNYTVNAGSVTQLIITLPGETFTDGSGNSGTASHQTVNSQFTIPSITATDSYFNIDTGYSGAKTLAYSGPSGTPSYTTSVSFTNGVSTTALLTTLTIPETTTITVTDGGQYGYASSSLTVDTQAAQLRGGTQIKGGTKIY